METAVTPPAESDLHLLTDWGEPGRNARIGRSAALSLLSHAAAILFVLVIPETLMQPPRPKMPETLITPLIMPRMTVTQIEPNPTKTIRDVRSADLTPRVKPPVGPSPEPQAAAPRKTKPLPPPPPPKAAPQTPLPEPPKLEIAPNENPKLTLPVQQAQVSPKPPSPFEDVKPPTPAPAGQRPADLGGQTLEGAIRGALAGRGGIDSQGTAPIASSGADLPALLSDPKGVDFKPYLAQVRAAVERAWRIILPKNGHRGYVSVQFAIQRDGTVRTVAFAQSTGDRSLDDTAIIAISQGGPFGPLPTQYTEAEIHVQMNFAYNQPRQ
jgi:TonB family protein